jgi:WD40 repeat protein
MLVAIAYSPDGRHLATGGDDKAIRLWDARTGVELRRFFGHEQMVLAVAFSPDGRQMLSGSVDNTARLWDVATGQELRRVRGHTLMVSTVAFSPDGRQVLTASYDKTAGLWDTATAKSLQTLRGHDKSVHCAVFSPDGKQVLTGSLDGTARLWDAATGQELRRFQGHTAPIRSVAFRADGQRVATGADDGTARQWELATARELHRFTAPAQLIPSVLVLPDGERAGTGSLGGSGRLWDIATGKELCQVAGQGSLISAVALSPDGRDVATGCLNGGAAVWELATGRPRCRLESRVGEVATVVFSPNGQHLLTGGKDGVARLWHAASGRQMQQFVGHQSPLLTVAFSRDGKRIATGSGGYQATDRTARVWEAATGKPLCVLQGHTDDVNAVALSADGTQVLTGSSDKTARLWDAVTGKEVRRFTEHTQRVYSVAFSPDGSRALTGSWDTTVRLWDLASGREVRRFETARSTPAVLPGQLVRGVAFSPDGRHVLTAGTEIKELTVRWFDAATAEHLRRCPANYEWPDLLSALTVSVAFSPDGRRFLTGTGDRTVRVWDAKSGMEMRCLQSHTAGVNAVAFAPEGRRMVSAGDDGMTRVWDVATGRELASLIGLRRGGEWMAVTPEGYFDGSLDARRMVMWKIGEALFPLEQYERRFHRPDLVTQALRGEPLDEQPPVPAGRTPPRARIQMEDVTPEFVRVKVTAAGGSQDAKIAAIRITVDGRDLPPDQARNIVRRAGDDGTVEFEARVEFFPGRQKALVAAMVTDDFGLQSDPAPLVADRPGQTAWAPVQLYVLAVGVSRHRDARYNLNFCHADAESLAVTLMQQKGRAFTDVQARVYTDEKATTAGIAAGLRWLEQSCTRADVAVVLFAGHGVLSPSGVYFVSHDGRVDDMPKTCVRWQDVVRRLKEIPAQQVLFLSDCCHAGAVSQQDADQDPLVISQDVLVEPLVRDAGVMVFASSRGNEEAEENLAWGHGAFTLAILDALRGDADTAPRDRRISISELENHVHRRVGDLTDERQHPCIPRLERFDIGLVLAHTQP